MTTTPASDETVRQLANRELTRQRIALVLFPVMNAILLGWVAKVFGDYEGLVDRSRFANHSINSTNSLFVNLILFGSWLLSAILAYRRWQSLPKTLS